MSQKKESESELTKRLIKQKHRDAWLVEYASIGKKLNASEFGAFTREGLFTYKLIDKTNIIKTGGVLWPEQKHGEVDHFAIKSIFSLDNMQFVTGSQGKDVQRFLEGEKENSFTKIKRKWHEKILGFRSGNKWKKYTAIIGYILIIFFIVGFINGLGEDSTDSTTSKTVSSEPSTETKTNNKLNPNTPVIFKNGEYITGKNILPGHYIVSTKDKEGANLFITRKDFSLPPVSQLLGTDDPSALTVDHLDVELKEGDKITLSNFESNVTFTPISSEEAEERKAEREAAAKKAAQEEQARKEQAARKAEQEAAQKQAQTNNISFKNCTEARAAGAAPVHRGEPGYASHLDRDGDGIGCDQ
ncbi:excalibur calcium-binding domain-containing protein [Priestia aryabhattai]|uniref:Excalibur calcium-binding domain-containing protein n=1 Tax=Priestia aryabhattai TaxID=412384 RepID=A0AAX6NI35_PRIAR|nr:excalibur calcium-binding domain-containing protein [Priestia aryabhattai]MDU9695185.1 excalibur calcium-binding domain-containing protein [Priestia aryabhattai]